MAQPSYGFDPNMPPEMSAEQGGLERRRRVAEMLMQRGMTPVQSTNPRSPMSWSQGLAQILQAYQGSRGLEEVDRGQAELGQKYQAGLADEVRRIAQMRSGAPATSEQIVDEQAAGGEGAPATIEAPAVPGDPRSSVMAALTSQYAPVRQMGTLEYGHMKKADEPYTLNPGDVRFGPDGRPLSAVPAKPGFKVGDTRTLIDGENSVVQEFQADGSWKEVGRGPRFAKSVGPSVTVQPAVTPVQVVRDGKEIVVDGRTGRVIGDSPKLSDKNKAEFKRQFSMQGIGATIQEADDLLSGKNGKPLPTGSGVGTAVDFVGGLFGMSPSGSVEAQRLKAIGGALTSKMPRMEGPQSDKDVALYKEMAAMVGDSTVPVERRRAALDTVKELWAKYERLNPGTFAGAAPVEAGGGVAPKVRVVDW